MTMTKCGMLLTSWLLIIGCIPVSQQLVIKSINVPATVKADEVDHVILDCDYELENTSGQELVVKWFFESDKVVYQWIQGRNPLAVEPAKKYVDLTYRASDDPYTEYRAMKLNKPGIELTGDYKCVISTFEDEKTANASMVVYATEEVFGFAYTKKTLKNDKDGLEATCMAKGLYPQPTLDISVKDVPNKQATKSTVTLRRDGLYDILSRIELLDEELPETTTTLECTLGIPKANYSASQMTVYNSGTATTTSAAIPQHEMDIQALNDSNPNNGGGNFIHTSIDPLLLLMHLLLFILFH
ncbi:uncharacterized protein LOC116847696 isoform X1 [Odontomachus brunneus]|uniref:uncharacterized protein LOC116847696 isoform X1 n=1 Tax=Odontomachus brunneus TaxID=486640 RepID=UPI0013F2740A|nr:uncharacterized protein LOC116847696 isoform X1 [Odontomachus brunneus]